MNWFSGFKKIIAAGLAGITLTFSAIGIAAAENAQMFFAPYTMNDANEITVPVYLKNLPAGNGVCGFHFSFAFDETQFSIKTTEEGVPLLETSDAMVFSDVAGISASLDGNIVTVDYLYYGSSESKILRDGPLFYYTLIPKEPERLYNSDDVYPLLFIAGSVQLRQVDAESGMIVSVPTEGIDVYVGGYNVFPTLESPSPEKTVVYSFGSQEMLINDVPVEMDVLPLQREGTTWIPIRFFAEAVGMDVLWDEENQTVSLYYPYKSTYVILGKEKIYINAVEHSELMAPYSENDRTYLSIEVIQAIFEDMLEVTQDENGLQFRL